MVCLTDGLHQGEGLQVSRQQDVVQVSVAAVQRDVPDVPYHDVLHSNIILPERKK